jgi:hypothetical protein
MFYQITRQTGKGKCGKIFHQVRTQVGRTYNGCGVASSAPVGSCVRDLLSLLGRSSRARFGQA